MPRDNFIQVDSPYSLRVDPNVLTLESLLDTHWRMDVWDGGAWELLPQGIWLCLWRVNAIDLERCQSSYTYNLARWEFSPDIDPDKVRVRLLMRGEVWEVPAIPPGGDYSPRRPVRVLQLDEAPPAAGVHEIAR